MAKKAKKTATRKKKTTRRKKAGSATRAPARRKKPAKKKVARRKTAKKKVAKKKTAKKKTAKKRATKKKAAKRKTAKRKPARKKSAKKKTAKQTATKNLTAVQKRLEKRVDKLSKQLEQMQGFVKRELAKDLKNTKKYADAEMALQKSRFDKVLERVKEENKELRTRLTSFVEEHEVLKDVTKGVSDTAKSLEERVRKLISGES